MSASLLHIVSPWTSIPSSSSVKITSGFSDVMAATLSFVQSFLVGGNGVVETTFIG